MGAGYTAPSAACQRLVTIMAQRLSMTTEGGETNDQRLKVAELGCTGIRGYLFSRPWPPKR